MHEINPADAQRIDDRPLYAPRRTYPACQGCCGQGHKLCPTPEACHLSEDEAARMGEGSGVLIWPLLTVIGGFALLAAVYFWPFR